MQAPAVDAYFSHLTSLYRRQPVAVVCVAHLVDTALHFLPAIDRLGELSLVLPKPNSIQPYVSTAIEEQYAVAPPLARSVAADAEAVLRLLDTVVGARASFCLMDVGGYFAPALTALSRHYGSRLRGVVEGTENGVQKYEELSTVPTALYSVARSPLKYPENHLVGSGIVFSIEAVLREQGKVLQGLPATVIGYGPIGRAVAHSLRGRDLEVVIYDRDPIALAEAAAHGFRIVRTTGDAIADAMLVVCATGRSALRGPDFPQLRPGAYVASVTSADDELALDELEVGYTLTPAAAHLSRYRRNRHWFYLLNEGNAVNFLHGGVLGSAIHLIEGEKLACLHRVITTELQPGISELSHSERARVAEVWLRHFAPG